jgi:hypothetical protein
MRDWQKAQDYVREWEARETEPKSTSEPMAVQQAKEKYLADAQRVASMNRQSTNTGSCLSRSVTLPKSAVCVT